MSSSTVGFALADEDRQRLERLVEHFGHGNRSAFLRASMKVMEGVMLADELRDLQAYGQRKLAERGLAVEDVPRLVREAIKGTSS
jgi:Arc/MetJ-type ribon-helix-helix transcriptional regulator